MCNVVMMCKVDKNKAPRCTLEVTSRNIYRNKDKPRSILAKYFSFFLYFITAFLMAFFYKINVDIVNGYVVNKFQLFA